MAMQNIAISFNLDDESQKALYDFVKFQLNGKKRNASAFVKMLIDREYQRSQQVNVMSSNVNGGIKLDLR